MIRRIAVTSLLFGILILSLMLTCYSGFILILQYQEQKNSEQLQKQLRQLRADGVIENFDFRTLNPEYVGWITIADTRIDYPVVQTTDNDTYLTRDFYGNSSKYGAVFVDCRCSLEETGDLILYGHHMKDGTMFADLSLYREPEAAQKYPQIMLEIEDNTRTYQIIAALEMDLMSGQAFDYTALLTHKSDVLEHIRSQAVFYSEPQGPLLLLSTCSYISDEARMIVLASQLPED